MKLDITSIIKDNGASIAISDTERLKDLESDLGTVSFISPVAFSGVVTNNNGMLTLTGVAEADYKTVCDRCEEVLERHLRVDIHEDIIERDDTLDNVNESDDDRFTFSGHFLELDRILADAILLNIPMQHLCKEDCKGLCPLCGARLNDQSCDCYEKQAVDPRMESLKHYFKG